jgi:hypothetical protein
VACRRLIKYAVVALCVVALAGCDVVYFDGSVEDRRWKSSPTHEETRGSGITQDQLYYAYLEVQTFQCYGPSSCPTILAGAVSSGWSVTLRHGTKIARNRCQWHFFSGTFGESIDLTCTRYTP